MSDQKGKSAAPRVIPDELDLAALAGMAKRNWAALVPGDVLALVMEVRRLRQGLFECFRLAGGDTDGDDGPQAWMGDIVGRVTSVVADLRNSYDEALDGLLVTDADPQGGPDEATLKEN